MNDKQIKEHLKKILPSAKLPTRILFETADDFLYLKLGGRGVVANMQTDESAFEGQHCQIFRKSFLIGKIQYLMLTKRLLNKPIITVL